MVYNQSIKGRDSNYAFFNIRYEFLVCLFITIFTIAAYWQIGHHKFVSFDDDVYIYENQNVKNGLTLRGLHWAFSLSDKGKTYWHPLTWLSHMLDCHLYGLHPGMHHWNNLILHILSSILLFTSFRRMTGALWESAFVAMLFALHPINVESVAWIAERKNVLSALFFMLSIFSYGYYCKRPTIISYLTVFLMFTLGLMAKPMLVILPFVLLLLDYWPLERFHLNFIKGLSVKANNVHPNSKPSNWNSKTPAFSFLFLEKVPFIIVSLTIVPFMASSVKSVVISAEAIPMSLRVSNALVSYISYIGKMLWPQSLAFFYPYPDAIPIWQITASVALLTIIFIIVFRHMRQRPYLLVGWLWYLGVLIPVSGILQVGLWPAMADRFVYIPFIGLFIIIAWGTPDLFKKMHFTKIGCFLMTVMLIPILMTKTWIQVRTWSDSVTLYKHAIQIDANNEIAHNNLGEICAEKARFAEAMDHYRAALTINPHFAFAHNNLGVALAIKGRVDEAVSHYLEAIRINPKYPEAHNNLGAAMRKKGNYNEAMEHYLKALSLAPNYEDAYYNLGIMFYAQGKFKKAINCYRKVLRINPFHVDALISLGNVLKRIGRFSESVRCYEKALSLSPKSKSMREGLKKSISSLSGS